MGRLFLLRCKQLFRLLPWVLIAAVVLSVCAAMAGTALVKQNTESEDQQKYRVALCAAEEDPLLQLGVEALKMLDDTRFTVELIRMEALDARQALQKGAIDAFVMLPEGFLQSALGGKVPTVPFVTKPGGSAVGQLFREQITGILANLLLSAQKGSYGAYYAMMDKGMEDQALEGLNALCLEYILLALNRGEALNVQILGVGDGVRLEEYLICGLTVVVIFLLCLPFTPMLVPKDMAVNQMLVAKGSSVVGQVLVDLVCPVMGMMAVTGCIFGVLALVGVEFGIRWADTVPVVLLAASMSYFICGLSAEPVSGVLVQFALSAGMGFVSGCLYPAYFFPIAVQESAKWLPTGVCRQLLCNRVAGTTGEPAIWVALGFTACFVCAGMWIRCWRIRHGKGAA